MFDTSALKLIYISLQIKSANGRRPISEYEEEFTSLSGKIFGDISSQDAKLTNYGFCVADDERGILPYCVNSICVCQRLSSEIDKYFIGKSEYFQDYPVLAGSAIFLGMDHPECNDLDVVNYITVNQDSKKRREIIQELWAFANSFDPEKVKIKPTGARMEFTGAETVTLGRESRQKYNVGLDRSTGNRPKFFGIDIADIESIIFNNVSNAGSGEKPVNVYFHCIQSVMENLDTHPYQEVHFCSGTEFFHLDRSWLVRSIADHFTFLKGKIAENKDAEDPVKSVKRAIVLAGITGAFELQGQLVKLLNMLSDSDSDPDREIKNKVLEEMTEQVDRLSFELEKLFGRSGSNK